MCVPESEYIGSADSTRTAWLSTRSSRPATSRALLAASGGPHRPLRWSRRLWWRARRTSDRSWCTWGSWRSCSKENIYLFFNTSSQSVSQFPLTIVVSYFSFLEKSVFFFLVVQGVYLTPPLLVVRPLKKCVCKPYHLLLFPVILSLPVFSSIILNWLYLVLVVVVSGLMVVVSGLITSTLCR